MKILVISSNLIGDTILSTCVIEHFVKIYPKSSFTFLIGPSAGQIYEHFDAKDKIYLIKKMRFNLHWLKMYSLIFNKKWDLVIDFRSSLISYFLIKRKKFIFKKKKSLNHLDQLKESFKLQNSSLKIYTNKFEEKEVNFNLDYNYRHIVIFPGGNWKPKIWPTNKYNILIKALIHKYKDLKFIIVGSLEEKKNYFNDIKKNIPNDYFIDIMGKSLTLTSAYMKKSNLFIGNDSGLTHLSVASNLTTICLFGPTNDKVYGHKNEKSFVIRTQETYEDFLNKSIDTSISHMLSIKPNQILNLIIKKHLL
ncbi:glycosyltransferase family 9 protein [Alphaproteobacteria bacterium]|nr:glycosyltransferase family 9 protein [Alphaproteobacteria bacterium]